MAYSKFVRVIQRRLLKGDIPEGYIFPLLEPLFMIETHMSFEERIKLFSLAASLPINFVACEVGSYLGASTCFLAAAASLKHGHVHAVDTWKNDAMPHEPVEDTWDRFAQNTDRFRLWITPHRGVAREVKDRVPCVDMLFIDGDHSYDGTLSDLTDFVPKLNTGGIVAMHDFDYDTVRAAADEYFKNRQTEDLGQTDSLKSFRLL
ncbi:MAG: class I SAM-dependent methyltransferase [Pirellulales bacterium]